jgi:predicted transposase YdaD
MSKSPANVHDAFFKQALADPKLAALFLREHLPSDIAGLLSPEPPEPVPGSFVDEELQQHHTDLLFRIRLKSGPAALAYVLMEHKSSPDPGARLQLLRYVVRVLTRWYDQNEQPLPLPTVFPLLVHQGPERWTLSCEFADLFGVVPQLLRSYVPCFRHGLVDLAQIDDRDLSSDISLRAVLKALKYSRRPDLPDRIDIVLAEAPVLEEKVLFVILTYLDRIPINAKIKVQETLLRLVPERRELIMGWLTQPYYEQGFAEGHAQGEAIGEARGEAIGEARGEAIGKAQGEARGEAKVLLRLLEKRFGVIPTALSQRIFAADVSSIEAWVERAFDATDLQSIFDPN